MPKKGNDLIRAMLLKIKDPYKTHALKLYKKYYTRFNEAPASKSYHLNFPGGLREHTLNVMICCKELYHAYFRIKDIFGQKQKVNYSKIIFVAFLHDLGKIHEYKEKPYRHHTNWIVDMLRENKIVLGEDLMNALFLHHGGYSGRRDKLNALAIILHSADMIASQVIED